MTTFLVSSLSLYLAILRKTFSVLLEETIE